MLASGPQSWKQTVTVLGCWAPEVAGTVLAGEGGGGPATEAAPELCCVVNTPQWRAQQEPSLGSSR